jgi:hypothetical protein
MAQTGVKLGSGSLANLEALGAGGEPAYRAASQIRSVVRQRIGPATADILAIPERDDHAGRVDWYAPMAGEPTSFASLTGEQQRVARATLTAEMNRITAYADELVANPRSPTELAFGQLLRVATTIPDEQQIHIIDGRPVVTFWGFRLHGATACGPVEGVPLKPAVEMASVGDETPPSAPIPTSEISRKFKARWQVGGVAPSSTLIEEWSLRRLPWLLLALCLLLLLIAGLWAGWRYRQTPPVASLPVPSAGSQSAGAGAAPGQASGANDLVIPEDVRKRGDVAFFHGRWRSVTALRISGTGEPLTVGYTFDAAGQGTGSIVLKSGVRCEAPIRVSFQGESAFVIEEVDASKCSDGTQILKSNVRCTVEADGHASCQGTQSDNNQYNVGLSRDVN